MRLVFLDQAEPGWHRVVWKFSEDVLEIVRSVPDSGGRRFDWHTKTWMVADQYVDALVERLRAWGHQVEVNGIPVRTQRRDPEQVALELLEEERLILPALS